MSAIPYSIRKAVKKRSGMICEARLLGCQIQAMEIHHKKLRSRGGSHHIDNLIAICNFCHNKLTNNTATKEELEKFTIHSWEKEC